MIRFLAPLALSLIADLAVAETLVAARTIRAGEAIGPGDVRPAPAATPGAIERPELVVGLSARRILHAGRPIMPEDVGPPAIVMRNAFVELVYHRPGLTITAEGRALDSGAVGDRVRVMNQGSRQTVFGTVAPDGSVVVAASR